MALTSTIFVYNWYYQSGKPALGKENFGRTKQASALGSTSLRTDQCLPERRGASHERINNATGKTGEVLELGLRRATWLTTRPAPCR